MMKLLALILLASVLATAQTRDSLTKRFGAPILESFAASPDTSITVTYGKQGEICEIRIAPKSRDSKVTSEQLMAFADELVPSDVRGKHIISGFLSGVSFYGGTDEYERVRVVEIQDTTVPGYDVKRWVSVVWKSASCKSDQVEQQKK